MMKINKKKKNNDYKRTIIISYGKNSITFKFQFFDIHLLDVMFLNY